MKVETGRWRHSKSAREYRVLGIAHHSENMEKLVVYQAEYHSTELGPRPLFVRPIAMWQEEIEIDGVKLPRFVQLPDAN